MNKTLRARLLASALIASAASLILIPEIASAQEVSAEVNFNAFHDKLSAYGNWSHNARYGDVWRPRDVDADFHPYSSGHWVDTEYGFTWVSDYQWGDVPFHYGRWVNDADDGWVWVPGYVWAPAWVVWRSDNDYMGWAPMPPDERFLAGDETRFDVDPVAFYGPRFDAGNLFIFVGTRHIVDPNFRAYIVQRPVVVNIFRGTRNITRISIVNDHVVNRSVDVRTVERFTRQPIRQISIRTVLKPGAVVTNVRIGRDIDIRERVSHPRGNNGNNNNNNDHGGNGNDHNGNNDNGHGPNGNNGNGNDHGDKNNDHGGNNNDHGGNSNDHGTDHGGNNNDHSGTQGGHDNANMKPDATGAVGTTPPASDQTPSKTKHHKTTDDSMQGSSPSGSDQGMSGGNSGGGMSGGSMTGSGAGGGTNTPSSDQTPSKTKHHKTNDNSMQGSQPDNGAMQGPQTTAAPPHSSGSASGPATPQSGSQQPGSSSQDGTPPKHKKKEDDNGATQPSGATQ